MRADIVEGLNFIVAVARDDDRRVPYFDGLCNKAAWFGELFDTADSEPGAFEEIFPLKFEIGRGTIGISRYGRGAEFRPLGEVGGAYAGEGWHFVHDIAPCSGNRLASGNRLGAAQNANFMGVGRVGGTWLPMQLHGHCSLRQGEQ